ncbi:MAG: hypothetical protein WA191_20965 [Telluria sp.]
MPTSKILVAGALLASIFGLTACGGGNDSYSTTNAVVLNIPDPVQPVAADVTIGGVFAGGADNPPNDIEQESVSAIIYRDAESNSLTRAEIDQTLNFNLDIFASAFDAVRSAQPNLHFSSNEFARAIITELTKAYPKASNRPLLAAAGIFDTFADLTPAEKELVLKNPYKAYMSKAAAEDAVAATGALFTGSRYLTRADAFRHSYWNWLMSKCCTVEWATAFATAHESGVPNNDDKRMDLNNNMIGRRLFLKSPQSTAAETQAALLDYKLLWINSKKKNVTVGVDHLVYLEPAQSATVFDDGPDYDDIYTIMIVGKNVGSTPTGGSKAFEFDQIPSGTHAMDISCKLDGTKGGCGFEIQLQGALTLPSGAKTTSQIVIEQSQTHSTTITFPTMKTVRTD